MDKIIAHNKKAYILIAGAVKVQLKPGGKYVEVSREDLMSKKEYKSVLTKLLTNALENPIERRKGYKRNAEKKVLDTKGKIYTDTWKTGGQIAYETEIVYGGLFKEVEVAQAAQKEDDKTDDNPKK